MQKAQGTIDFGQKYRNKNPLARYLINNFYRHLSQILYGMSPQNILEVGCGEGFSTARIMEALTPHSNYLAVDIEPSLVEKTKARNPQVDAEVASVLELPYADKSFDLVICLEVLEHLDTPARGLEELCRVSRQSIIVSVPHEPFFRIAQLLRGKNIARLGNDEDHRQNWSPAGFKEFLANHVDILQSHYPFPWQQILGRAKNA